MLFLYEISLTFFADKDCHLFIFSLDLTNIRKLVVIKKQSNKQWLKRNNNKLPSIKVSVDNCELIIAL